MADCMVCIWSTTLYLLSSIQSHVLKSCSPTAESNHSKLIGSKRLWHRNFGRWGLFSSHWGQNLGGYILSWAPLLSFPCPFLPFLLPPWLLADIKWPTLLHYGLPLWDSASLYTRDNKACWPWTETSAIMNQNKSFFFYVVSLRYFVTAMKNRTEEVKETHFSIL
jgi:hypothetical protein